MLMGSGDFLLSAEAGRRPAATNHTEQTARGIDLGLDPRRFAVAVFEGVRQPLIVLDLRFHVASANPAFFRTFGIEPEDTLERSYFEIDGGRWDLLPLRSRLERLVRQDDRLEGFETVHPLAPKGPRHVLTDARRISAQGESDGLILVSLEDITRRRETERQMAAAAQEMRRSNQELEEFASVAAHDLQEPLRKICSFGDRLQASCGETLGTRSRESLEKMLAAARRMQRLIDDLLAYARIATGGRPFEPVNLHQVVHDVLANLEAQVERSGGSIEVGGLPTALADPAQMRQLFQNLIGNALKFRRPDVPPLVRIQGRILDSGTDGPASSMAASGFCELEFEDNGIGFELKYAERIFGVFERLHGWQEYEGTGIGLALCRRIVARHGGTITVRSQPHQGSTFRVTLPLSEMKANQHE